MASLPLQLKYHDTFEKYCSILKNKIDLSKGSFMKDLKAFIEAEHFRTIEIEMDSKEQVVKTFNYLMQKNSVPVYKTFINIWKKWDEAKANQFEANLKQEIDNAGLTAEDNRISPIEFSCT